MIILGLDESKGFTPASGFRAIEIAESLKELVRERRSGETLGALSPAVSVSIDIIDFEDAEIVVAQVEELRPDLKPCFVTAKGKENGSYERLLDGDHRMGTHAIFLFDSNRAQPTQDIQIVSGASRSDLDDQLVQGLIRRVKRTRPRIATVATTDDEVLTALRVIDRDSGGVTLAGLLALGKYPQEFFPQLMISFAAFPTPNKDTASGEIRMLDRATFEGPIPSMIEDATQKLGAALTSRRLSLGASSRDVLEVPLDVIREAVANAVAHRDYSSYAESEQVRIEMFPDRIEISNPGGIWGGRTERELLDGTSRSRNSYLTRLLTDVPLASGDTVSENSGSGLRFMIGTMKESGLPVPSFDATNTSFTTILARHGLMDPQTRGWLSAIGADSLDERALAVLALAQTKVRVDDQDVRHQLDMDSFDAWKLLVALSRDGWLSEPQKGVFSTGPRITDTPLFEGEDLVILRNSDLTILGFLSNREGLTAREISRDGDLSINVVRQRLRSLIASGFIEATASPTSKLRAYRVTDLGKQLPPKKQQ